MANQDRSSASVIKKLSHIQQDIIRYSRENKAKIRDIFGRIPSELSEKNKRLILANVRKTARMERCESAFLWLCDAGVAFCRKECMVKVAQKDIGKGNE